MQIYQKMNLFKNFNWNIMVANIELFLLYIPISVFISDFSFEFINQNHII